MESFSDDIAKTRGPIIDNPAYFPDGINVEFAKKISENEIEIKVWERGSGATLACGTGACAAIFCGIKKGIISSPIKVRMPGGSVTVELKESNRKEGIIILNFRGVPEFLEDGSVEIK